MYAAAPNSSAPYPSHHHSQYGPRALRACCSMQAPSLLFFFPSRSGHSLSPPPNPTPPLPSPTPTRLIDSPTRPSSFPRNPRQQHGAPHFSILHLLLCAKPWGRKPALPPTLPLPPRDDALTRRKAGGSPSAVSKRSGRTPLRSSSRQSPPYRPSLHVLTDAGAKRAVCFLPLPPKQRREAKIAPHSSISHPPSR